MLAADSVYDVRRKSTAINIKDISETSSPNYCHERGLSLEPLPIFVIR